MRISDWSSDVCSSDLTLTTLNVAMQLRSPEEILGRCLSIYQATTFGAMALGAYTLGLVADLSSLPVAMLGAAGSILLSALVLRFVSPMQRRAEGRILPLSAQRRLPHKTGRGSCRERVGQ